MPILAERVTGRKKEAEDGGWKEVVVFIVDSMETVCEELGLNKNNLSRERKAGNRIFGDMVIEM